MKIGKITESFDSGEQEKQEETGETGAEFESDGIQYHVESFEKKYHDLFSRKYDSLSEDQKKDVEDINEKGQTGIQKGILICLMKTQRICRRRISSQIWNIPMRSLKIYGITIRDI